MEATTEIKVGIARLQDRQCVLEMAMELKGRRLDIYVPMVEAFILFFYHEPSLPTVHGTLPARSITLFQCLYTVCTPCIQVSTDLRTFVSLGNTVHRAIILHKFCMEKG